MSDDFGGDSGSSSYDSVSSSGIGSNDSSRDDGDMVSSQPSSPKYDSCDFPKNENWGSEDVDCEIVFTHQHDWYDIQNRGRGSKGRRGTAFITEFEKPLHEYHAGEKIKVKRIHVDISPARGICFSTNSYFMQEERSKSQSDAREAERRAAEVLVSAGLGNPVGTNWDAYTTSKSTAWITGTKHFTHMRKTSPESFPDEDYWIREPFWTRGKIRAVLWGIIMSIFFSIFAYAGSLPEDEVKIFWERLSGVVLLIVLFVIWIRGRNKNE